MEVAPAFTDASWSFTIDWTFLIDAHGFAIRTFMNSKSTASLTLEAATRQSMCADSFMVMRMRQRRVLQVYSAFAVPIGRNMVRTKRLQIVA